MSRNVIVLAIVVVLLLPVAYLTLLSVMARRPTNLGPSAGRLAPCPDSPNCVSTQAEDEEHRIEPLHFTGSASDAMERLRQVIRGMPRARIFSEADNYIHAEFTSAIFRYVDDVEFLIDPETSTIHFRSASRVGYSDLGANRKRMETIRQAFNESASTSGS